jgi:hypothetical protein
MPADQCGWLYHSQHLPPVKPAREPRQGHPSRLRGTMWLDLAFMVEGQLFAQKKIFYGEYVVRTQAEAEEAQAIPQERQ